MIASIECNPDSVLKSAAASAITSSISIIVDRSIMNLTLSFQLFFSRRYFDLISIKEANHFIPWTHFETIRDALLNLKLE